MVQGHIFLALQVRPKQKQRLLIFRTPVKIFLDAWQNLLRRKFDSPVLLNRGTRMGNRVEVFQISNKSC
jgi:hypothetical protein